MGVFSNKVLKERVLLLNFFIVSPELKEVKQGTVTKTHGLLGVSLA
jgi:hypothetical protein